VDLVEGEVRTEEFQRLVELAIQRVDAQVLDLLALSVETPAADVGVSPFRADRDVASVQTPLWEPAGDEALGATVRAGDIDAAQAGLIRGVEDRVGAAAQRLEPAIGSELRGASGGDVRRAAERGEAQPDPGRTPQRLRRPARHRSAHAR
jgi:hypothetical protein